MSTTTPAPTPGSHFADPAPLGLGAFALTTFVLSCVNINWLSNPADTGIVLGLALAFGGIAQLAAGLWEFAKGNTFGATAFCSYGGFWISFWWLAEHDLGALKDVDKSLGVYLLAWGIFTAYMAVAATRVSGAVLAIFVLLTITFFLLAIGHFEAVHHASTGMNLIKTGGWFGIATAIAAWYTSFAGVTKQTFGREILPVMPLEKRLFS